MTPLPRIRAPLPRQQADGWFIFVALSDPGFGRVLVRVGATPTPIERIADIHRSAQYPVLGARFAMVGTKSAASKLAARMCSTLTEFAGNTRPMWFELDPENELHKRRIAAGFDVLFATETGRKPEWKSLQADQIQAAAELGKVTEKKMH